MTSWLVIVAVLMGSSGIAGVAGIYVTWRLGKRTADQTATQGDRREDREDDRLDLEALARTNERLVAVIDTYRQETGRIERLEQTVERQGRRIESLEVREQRCQQELARAHQRIEELMAR